MRSFNPGPAPLRSRVVANPSLATPPRGEFTFSHLLCGQVHARRAGVVECGLSHYRPAAGRPPLRRSLAGLRHRQRCDEIVGERRGDVDRLGSHRVLERQPGRVQELPREAEFPAGAVLGVAGHRVADRR